MLGLLKRRWLESRALAVLQVHFEQQLQKPLPPFEAQLLRGAANLSLKDGGTPFDAAARFYAAFAETAVRRGVDLNSIQFGLVSARVFALRDRMHFYGEHIAALKTVSDNARLDAN